MIVTLLVSFGAAWEARALGALNQHAGVVVLKRCVDLDDLLATASAGQAHAVVLGADLPGLDAAVVSDLHGYGVRVLAVAADVDVATVRAARSGIDTVVAEDRVDGLGDLVAGLPADVTLAAPASPVPPPPGAAAAPPAVGTGPGRVIAVWGPGGGPGRTTVAIGLAAELARRQVTTVLLDADPYGGSVAQQLGVLDEVSGLLAAARLAAAGTLEERGVTTQRRLSERLRVVTGLPRPDRWTEVRPGVLADVVEHARRTAQVVVDTGFSIERDLLGDPSGRPDRNAMTVEALEQADEILVVGSADPVGLARLARAVADAHDTLALPTLRLVVNRMRPTLGWRESDVVAMLSGFGPHAGVHFLPDDQPAVDRAHVAGRTLLESGDSPLTKAIAAVVDAMAGIARRR